MPRPTHIPQPFTFPLWYYHKYLSRIDLRFSNGYIIGNNSENVQKENDVDLDDTDLFNGLILEENTIYEIKSGIYTIDTQNGSKIEMSSSSALVGIGGDVVIIGNDPNDNNVNYPVVIPQTDWTNTILGVVQYNNTVLWTGNLDPINTLANGLVGKWITFITANGEAKYKIIGYTSPNLLTIDGEILEVTGNYDVHIRSLTENCIIENIITNVEANRSINAQINIQVPYRNNQFHYNEIYTEGNNVKLSHNLNYDLTMVGNRTAHYQCNNSKFSNVRIVDSYFMLRANIASTGHFLFINRGIQNNFEVYINAKERSTNYNLAYLMDGNASNLKMYVNDFIGDQGIEVNNSGAVVQKAQVFLNIFNSIFQNAIVNILGCLASSFKLEVDQCTCFNVYNAPAGILYSGVILHDSYVSTTTVFDTIIDIQAMGLDNQIFRVGLGPVNFTGLAPYYAFRNDSTQGKCCDCVTALIFPAIGWAYNGIGNVLLTDNFFDTTATGGINNPAGTSADNILI